MFVKKNFIYVQRTSVLSWIAHVRRSHTQAAGKRTRSAKVAADRIVPEAAVVSAKQLARHQDDAHTGGDADGCDLIQSN